ncbi:bifunctional 4-hydroxy-2-oxoglutarate aldolase/2-dehydro-3-deoxy-phosphogluconate aldolase [Microbacterium oleivorans]|uniref:bifunctional 4-hydroxy-2-oxoglutarate aldolase/2-dehydro-3-deoxy-phosphogluconate aldolase n=1 Tax=Microbacterium oleivorans TaxID=273677 RepID=UPI00203E09BE|nr:bifunctional 4-hydroxy-2-oxoglutarate aldolase/2-dehydro-3-deoxy-phosphogluconate aldolase [Microbacterium oleivorans]MCM3694846.1 bifunctional 4-hydroxy-2-oxoglutarate aldolase/2-dehydro-3-deoxy-phosphogluconate aldolase [Microbacterium oleivorans]
MDSPVGGARIVPVVVLQDAASAHPLADALVAGGIRCAEITLRTAAGLDAIDALRDRQDIVVGAGTVLSPEQVDDVADAGARFAVSPGFDPRVLERCLARGIPLVPGVATATEIQQALGRGLRHLKLFPAKQIGGLDAIRAFAGPFPDACFMPSGGVSPANASDYLAHAAVFAVSGSWMVPSDALEAGDFTRIEELSRRALAAL